MNNPTTLYSARGERLADIASPKNPRGTCLYIGGHEEHTPLNKVMVEQVVDHLGFNLVALKRSRLLTPSVIGATFNALGEQGLVSPIIVYAHSTGGTDSLRYLSDDPQQNSKRADAFIAVNAPLPPMGLGVVAELLGGRPLRYVYPKLRQAWMYATGNPEAEEYDPKVHTQTLAYLLAVQRQERRRILTFMNDLPDNVRVVINPRDIYLKPHRLYGSIVSPNSVRTWEDLGIPDSVDPFSKHNPNKQASVIIRGVMKELGVPFKP